MKFDLGCRVKWKEACPIRLGYKASDMGKVVGVHEDPEPGEIDVEFDNGDVVHRAAGHWFEAAGTASKEDADTPSLPEFSAANLFVIFAHGSDAAGMPKYIDKAIPPHLR